MGAAAAGAHEARGLTVGVLPTYQAGSADPAIDVAIPTGMGHARNVIVVAAGDAVIAFAGEHGTASEIALAQTLARPVVVLGAWIGDVPGAQVVVNEEWPEGMGSSLRMGLSAVAAIPEIDRVLITLVDLPGLTDEAIRRVIASDARIAQAVFDGERGHPVMIGRENWEQVSEVASGDRGARDSTWKCASPTPPVSRRSPLRSGSPHGDRRLPGRCVPSCPAPRSGRR